MYGRVSRIQDPKSIVIPTHFLLYNVANPSQIHFFGETSPKKLVERYIPIIAGSNVFERSHFLGEKPTRFLASTISPGKFQSCTAAKSKFGGQTATRRKCVALKRKRTQGKRIFSNKKQGKLWNTKVGRAFKIHAHYSWNGKKNTGWIELIIHKW